MIRDEWSVWAGTVEAFVWFWVEERERRVRGGPLLKDLFITDRLQVPGTQGLVGGGAPRPDGPRGNLSRMPWELCPCQPLLRHGFPYC